MKLTARQFEVLQEHMDVTDGVPMKVRSGRRAVTFQWLLKHGLLRGDRPARPRRTFITQRGRLQLARYLGRVADEIVSARKVRNQEHSNRSRRRRKQGNLSGDFRVLGA